MKTISRRAFARTLITAAVIPPVAAATQTVQQTPQITASPVGGYLPTAEEQRLMDKFLADHEARMAPLRERRLGNDLSPLFFTRPPATGRPKS